MALNLGTLTVTLKASVAKFKADMASVSKVVEANKAGFAKLALGGTAAAAGVALLGVAALKASAGFEQGMARVGAVASATAEQLDRMREAALANAAATQFTARQAAGAMTLLAQAGFAVEEVITALPGVLSLASAGQLDLSTATDIAASTLRGMGLEVDQLGRVNDVLISAMTGANTNVQQLGEAMKFVAPVAKSAGISFEETAAAISIMSNAGIGGSLAGTALRGAITKLLNPSKEAAKVINELGLRVTDAQGDLIPFADIIDQLGQSGVKTGQLMEIFGLRAGPGVAALISQGADKLREFEDRLRSSGGIAQEISEKQLATLSGQMLILQSKLEGVAIAFGDALAPAAKLVVSVLQGVLDIVQAIPGPIKVMGVALAATAAAAAALAASVAVLGLALPAFKAGLAALPIVLGSAKAAMVALGFAAKTAMTPIPALFLAAKASVFKLDAALLKAASSEVKFGNVGAVAGANLRKVFGKLGPIFKAMKLGALGFATSLRTIGSTTGTLSGLLGGLKTVLAAVKVAFITALGGVPLLIAAVVISLIAIAIAIKKIFEETTDLSAEVEKSRKGELTFGEADTEEEKEEKAAVAEQKIAAKRKSLSEKEFKARIKAIEQEEAATKAKMAGLTATENNTALLERLANATTEARDKTEKLTQSFETLKAQTEQGFGDVESEEIGEAIFDSFAPSLEAIDAAAKDTTVRIEDFGGRLKGIELGAFSKGVDEATARLGTLVGAKKVKLETGVGGIFQDIQKEFASAAENLVEASTSFADLADQQEAAAKAIQADPSSANAAAALKKAFGKVGEDFLFLEQIGADLRAGGQIFANTVLGALDGLAGEVVSAAAQGFQAGGVIGAIIAVIAELLTNVAEFSVITDKINEALVPLLKGLDGLLKGIAPITNLNLGFLGTAFAFLGAVLKTLGIAIGLGINVLVDFVTEFVIFARSLGVNVGDTITQLQSARVDLPTDPQAVADEFGQVWVEFGETAAAVWETGLTKTRRTLAGVATDAGESLAESLAGVTDFQEQREFGFGVSRAEDALGGLADAANTVSASLLNVPTGFKIAAARFAATSVDGGFGNGPMMAAAEPSKQVNVELIKIVDEDPRRAWARIQRVAEEEGFSDTGAGTDGAGIFSLPQTGGQNV